MLNLDDHLDEHFRLVKCLGCEIFDLFLFCFH